MRQRQSAAPALQTRPECVVDCYLLTSCLGRLPLHFVGNGLPLATITGPASTRRTLASESHISPLSLSLPRAMPTPNPTFVRSSDASTMAFVRKTNSRVL